MIRVRQQFERPKVEDVAGAVRTALERLELGGLGATIRPGQRVALTAGSRGIANIPLVLRSVAEAQLINFTANRLLAGPSLRNGFPPKQRVSESCRRR
jgi:hypothetical protein